MDEKRLLDQTLESEPPSTQGAEAYEVRPYLANNIGGRKRNKFCCIECYDLFNMSRYDDSLLEKNIWALEGLKINKKYTDKSHVLISFSILNYTN